ncbi:MAG: hypothetical protein K6F14_07770 [Clostridiales bacterium]|nr:hypothetical protein [Clostridiales bacterium]
MKKSIIIILIMVLAMCIISCQDNTEKNFYYQDGTLLLDEIPKQMDVSKFYMCSSMLSSAHASIDSKSDGVRILSEIGNFKAERILWENAIKNIEEVQQVFAKGLQINYSAFSIFVGADGTVLVRADEYAYLSDSGVVEYDVIRNLCEEVAAASNQLYY